MVPTPQPEAGSYRGTYLQLLDEPTGHSDLHDRNDRQASKCCRVAQPEIRDEA